MSRLYCAILLFLIATPAHASDAAEQILKLWGEKAEYCRGNSMNDETAWACGERDAYMHSLAILGACKEADPADQGCTLK